MFPTIHSFSLFLIIIVSLLTEDWRSKIQKSGREEVSSDGEVLRMKLLLRPKEEWENIVECLARLSKRRLLIIQ